MRTLAVLEARFARTSTAGGHAPHVQNENTFYFAPAGAEPIPVMVWGTGNMGRAAIRAVDANPGSTLAAVVVNNPAKVGRDAGDLADLGRDLGVAAGTDVEAALATLGGAGAVAYTASGDVRPDEAAADVRARSPRGPSSSRRRSTRSTTSATPRPTCASPCSPRPGRVARRCS